MHFLTQKLSLSTPKVKGAGPALVFCLHHHHEGCPSFAGFAKLGTTDLALADPVMQPSLRSSAFRSSLTARPRVIRGQNGTYPPSGGMVPLSRCWYPRVLHRTRVTSDLAAVTESGDHGLGKGGASSLRGSPLTPVFSRF